jgi:hypothetical protein
MPNGRGWSSLNWCHTLMRSVPELAALDFPMTDGVLRVRARAALAGYVLRRWNVDCSPDHGLRGPEYSLWLRDPLVACMEWRAPP